MDDQHDPISYFMEMAEYVIDSPLRTSEQAKDFLKPMNKVVPKLKTALESADEATIKQVIEKMIELRDALFISLCDGIVEMTTRESLPLSHPGSAANIMFAFCATLTVFADEKLDMIDAEHLEVARLRGLCIYTDDDPRIDPRGYTAQNLLDLTWLISNRWPLLRVTDKQELEGVFKYIQQLVHRAFVIIGSPRDAQVHNSKLSVPIEGTSLCMASHDMIRRFVYGFGLPMAHIRIMFSLEWKRPKFIPPLDESAMRAALKKRMLSNAEKLMRLPTLRQEVRLMLDRLSVRHCDFAVYIEQCNMEPFEPTSMMMMTKPPEYQTASMQYNRCVDFRVLIETVDEADPDYDKKHDLLAHLNAQNIKLHAASVDLTEYGINLRGDYVLTEADMLKHVFNTMNEPFPSLISFMGLYHVIMGTTLFLCDGVEQALCVWTQIILSELECKLAGTDMVPGLVKMFNNKPTVILPHVRDADNGGGKAAGEEATWGDEAFI